MPIIQRFLDSETLKLDGMTKKMLLPKKLLSDERINIEYLEIEKGKEFEINNNPNELAWIQIVDGLIKSGDECFDKSKIIFFSFGLEKKFAVENKAILIISKVPNAINFENEKHNNLKNELLTIDWHKEPVLNSEHDSRKRIYLISETLSKTSAVKGELIIYPSNTRSPEHFHMGAEHYQLIISGEINAVLGGVEHKLKQFDLVYNFENENHWFYNSSNSECHFVEFFVPGHSKTVWSSGMQVCTWSPTGSNFIGGAPSRNIEKHIHGEGKDI